MAGEIIEFVDSINVSAGVNLSLTTLPWRVIFEGTSAPPPPLKRAVASTLLADGAFIPASAYDNRLITLQLLLASTSAATMATQAQMLARELDRETNILRWQPEPGIPAVYFRTYRSADFVTVIDHGTNQQSFTVSIVAEPFALGEQVVVSPIAVSNNPASPATAAVLRGVSVSGAEVNAAAATLPGTYSTDYSYENATTLAQIINRGHKVIRMPFRWERLQPTRNAALNVTELGRITQFVSDVQSAGATTVIIPDNKARYINSTANGGATLVLGGTLPQADFVDFWTRLSAALINNTGVERYDLMGHPHGMTNAAAWQTAAQAAVNAIRANGDTHWIGVPGYQSSSTATSAKTWVTNHPTEFIVDPLNKLFYVADIFFDTATSGAYASTYAVENSAAVTAGYGSLSARITDELNNFTDWLAANGERGFIGEIGWPGDVDTASWNAVGETAYSLLDATATGATYYTAGSRLGTSNRLSVYTETLDRSALVMGVDEPYSGNTGVLPGVTRTTVNANVTLSTPGEVYADKTVNGYIIVTAANVTIRNCLVQGQNSAPSGAIDMINVKNAAVTNCLIEDVTIAPQFSSYQWQSGITGHDFIARRCNITKTVDGINVFKQSAGTYYDTNVIIEQCYIGDLGWWTAATSGVVHTSDTETHNDCIQHQGGSNTIIRGNALVAYFARQYGHFQVTNPASTTTYTTVTLGSLPDGGPFQAVPTRGVTGGAALSTGVIANGAHNWDDLSCFMGGHQVGRTTALLFEKNWCYGGNYAVNNGQTYAAGDVTLGNFRLNKFSYDQGDYSSGSPGNTNSNTITCSTTWATHVTSNAGTADANRYFNGEEINFRGD